MLFLWFTLFGIDGHSAEASVRASASVASPVSIYKAIGDFWSSAYVRENIAGYLIISIATMGLPVVESGSDANAIRYLAIISNSHLAQFTMADFIKLIADNGVLNGNLVSAFIVDVTSETGIAIVTVAYN